MSTEESGLNGHGQILNISQSGNPNTGRVVIMAEYPIEKTTDVPEHAFLAVR